MSGMNAVGEAGVGWLGGMKPGASLGQSKRGVPPPALLPPIATPLRK